MKRFTNLLPALAALAVAGAAQAGPVDGLLAEYEAAGAGPFSPDRGAAAWTAEQPAADGTSRACASCHGADLRAPGEHLRTGKRIEPLAPRVNPARLSDRDEIRKWLYRNCKWTYGRECTPQEKGDFLTFIRSR